MGGAEGEGNQKTEMPTVAFCAVISTSGWERSLFFLP